MRADLQKARAIFLHAVGNMAPEQWEGYVADACGSDAELARQARHLLKVHVEAGSFLEQPVVSAVAAGDFAPAQVTEVPAPFDEGAGSVIGPYKLLEQIGEGGMGTVFMAEQSEPVQRKVALKIIKPGMDSRQIIGRFEAERQALAMMDHPNIAKVLDAGTTSGVRRQESGVRKDGVSEHLLTPDPCLLTPDCGRPYFVMELVKGVPITKYCDEHNLTPRERLELFIPVCHAVMHAHQKGIIHRDLKPSNVLVARYDDKPVPKVIDFGVAKATAQKLTERTMFTHFGQLIGTLEYMSPEQASFNALDIDTRSDIYSLGVLLYELLVGSTPFEKSRLKETALDEILRIIREEEPPTPSTRLSESKETLASIAAQRKTEPANLTRLVRGDLDWIVMKALDKDRNRRYETASAFAADVERYLHDEPVQACPPSAVYRFRKFVRRKKVALVIAACAFLALAGLAGGIGWAVRDRAAREEEIDREETARRGKVEMQVQESLKVAGALQAANQPAMARQKLAEAKGLISNDRAALAGLAAEVNAFQADLDRFQRFFDLIDQAHQADIRNEELQRYKAWLGPDNSRNSRSGFIIAERQPAQAVPLLLQALARYEVLDRQDWRASLEQSVLVKVQVDQICRTIYEELVWLAQDLAERREDHRSGEPLSPASAARGALVYLGVAEIAHRPTHGFYEVRASCHKAMAQEDAARIDQELARQTPPTMAFDYYLRGQAAHDTKNNAEAIKALEAGLRLEPTHFWSLLMLGGCLSDYGQGPEDWREAVGVFTGCIMKRPEYANAYRCRGVTYSRLGQFDKAVMDCSKAIDLNPQNAQEWICRGTVYEAQREWDKALADFTVALDRGPNDARAWHYRGSTHRNLGQHKEALADYTKAIDLDPNNAVFVYNRGHLYAHLGKYDKAFADFSEAIRMDPKLAPPWAARGRIYHENLRRYKEAVADFTQAIDLDPGNASSFFNRGSVYYGLGRYDKAVDDFSKAIELDPQSARPWDARGRFYHEKLGERDKALADFTEAIKLDSENAFRWFARGFVYQSFGQLGEAVADYSKAIDLDPKLESGWNNRGQMYGKLGQAGKAIEDLSKAIDLNRKNSMFWSNRGSWYVALGEYEKGVADCTKAIDLDPNYAKPLVHRGRAHANRGQWDKAFADYCEAIKLDAKSGEAFARRGLVYQKQGQPDKALADYSKAKEFWSKFIEANPKNPQSYNDLAWQLATHVDPKFREPRRAVELAEKAVELAPTVGAFWNTLGTAHYRAGGWQVALDALNKSRKYSKGNDSYDWFFMAMAHWKLDHKEEARKFYKQAVQWMIANAPKNDELRRFRAEASELMGVKDGLC